MSTPEQPQDTPVDMAARERTLAWLKDHWTEDDHCPICGTDNWSIGDAVELPVRGGHLWVGTGQRAYVLVPIQCANCFYTFFLNAILAGIVPRSS